MILCTNFYIFLFEVSLDACTNESINFERTVAEVSLGACTNDESINFEKTVAEVSLSACTNDVCMYVCMYTALVTHQYVMQMEDGKHHLLES